MNNENDKLVEEISINDWVEQRNKEREDIKEKLGYNDIMIFTKGENNIQLVPEFKIRKVNTKFGLKNVIPIIHDGVDKDMFCNYYMLNDIISYAVAGTLNVTILKSGEGKDTRYEVYETGI